MLHFFAETSAADLPSFLVEVRGDGMRGYFRDVSTAGTDEVRLRRMPLEEWLALDRGAGARGEWVDGWLVEEEMGSLLHDVTVGWLITQLGRWAFARGALVAASELKLVVSPSVGRKPDATVFTHTKGRAPPAIAVEVVSPSARDQHRDRVTKRAEYAAYGIPIYLLLDPQARLLEIFRLGADGEYARISAAERGVVQVTGCEGLSLDLDELWAQTDRARSLEG